MVDKNDKQPAITHLCERDVHPNAPSALAAPLRQSAFQLLGEFLARESARVLDKVEGDAVENVLLPVHQGEIGAAHGRFELRMR